jgi:hypothetical protein
MARGVRRSRERRIVLIKLWPRLVTALGTMLLLTGFSAVSSSAAPICQVIDPVTGECTVWTPPPEGPPGDENPGSGGTGGGGGPVDPFITVNGVRCRPAGLVDPQPPKTEAIWGGHTDGAIYNCITHRSVAPAGPSPGSVIQYWAASAPVPPPDPAVLARQAVASMQLRAIDVGIVPEARPGSVGLVGMPNWMWVENPSQNTWGPITRTASAGGWTVTATARVAQVVWDMGDGQVVTCGEGTPYEDSFGKKSSPTCGHTYIRQGEYTVTATSQWVITWSGIGQTGTITMDLTRSADLTIGEAQVLRQ